jgi:hypothetical protein
MAWEKARTSPRHLLRGLMNHPLYGFRDGENFERSGKALFAILSEEVHGFSKEVSRPIDYWNGSVCKILEALTPTTAFKQDGEIDWEEERKRYY